ncbi:hypothetical protein FOZ63_030192, partial [Perkinsus olseni]
AFAITCMLSRLTRGPLAGSSRGILGRLGGSPLTIATPTVSGMVTGEQRRYSHHNVANGWYSPTRLLEWRRLQLYALAVHIKQKQNLKDRRRHAYSGATQRFLLTRFGWMFRRANLNCDRARKRTRPQRLTATSYRLLHRRDHVWMKKLWPHHVFFVRDPPIDHNINLRMERQLLPLLEESAQKSDLRRSRRWRGRGQPRVRYSEALKRQMAVERSVAPIIRGPNATPWGSPDTVPPAAVGDSDGVAFMRTTFSRSKCLAEE